METKPAIYSTEFLLTLAASIYMFLNASNILNQVPAKWAVGSWALIQAFYSLSRGVAKSRGTFDPHNSGNYSLFPTRKKVAGR